MSVDSNDDNNDYDLRELFCDRNPGDARVKVGSERQAATSPASAKPGVVKIGHFSRAFCPRGPCEIGLAIGEFTPIKSLILRGDFLWTSYSFSHSKQIWTKNRSVCTVKTCDFTQCCAQIVAFAT